jgi:internalin A
MPDNPIRRPWRRYLRLTVRAYLVLVLLVGAWLGWMIRAARIQRDAVAAIERAGGRLLYSWQWKNGDPIPFGKPIWPRWLVHRLGVDYFGHVALVSLSGMGNSSEFEPCVLQREAGGGVSVIGLGKNSSYVTLDLVQYRAEDPGDPSEVREEAMMHLGALTSLEELDLQRAWVDDTDLAHLKDLTNLWWLNLSQTRAGDAALAHLRRCTRLEFLSLERTRITDGGIVHLKGLPRLKELDLRDTRVTDAGLVHLKGLANLRELRLDGTKVTAAGAQELQKVLPMLKISHWSMWTSLSGLLRPLPAVASPAARPAVSWGRRPPPSPGPPTPGRSAMDNSKKIESSFRANS